MIAVKKDGELVRNGKRKVKVYGRREDVYSHYRCWDDTKLKTHHDVEIADLNKKELRDANR